jgi:hypothetical protein
MAALMRYVPTFSSFLVYDYLCFVPRAVSTHLTPTLSGFWIGKFERFQFLAYLMSRNLYIDFFSSNRLGE